MKCVITDRVSESLYCFQMSVVANAIFDDFSVGEHVLAHFEPYANFFFFFFLLVCVCVTLCVKARKTMLPHNSHICLCTCTKFATCLLHYIISDFWNFCLSMLIRSCPSGRTKFGKKRCYHITSTYVCVHVQNLQHAFSMILSRTCEIFVSLC